MTHDASTTRLPRRLLALALGALAALTLGACQPAAPPAAPPAAQPPAAAPTAAPAAVAARPAPTTTSPAALDASGLLAQVKARGVLRVANTQANPPWNFRDEKNELAGYDVDVANELAKRLGFPRVEFIQGTFQTFIPGVQTDKWDIVIAGQTITEERKLQVGFSEPYEINGVSIFVGQTNDAITSVADLAGKRIAVTAGGTQEKYAREKIPNAEIKSYENGTLALTDVSIGRADAYLGSRFVGAYLAEKNGLKVKATPGFLEQEVNAMSFKKDETTFKQAVDGALRSMVDDGTLSSISRKWLGGLDMAEELRKLPRT